MKDKLALLGGEKVIKKKMKPYRTIGAEEMKAVSRVMRSGQLSQFLGSWSSDFYGGKMVLNFEKKWRQYFKVRHAISVNSATSGLMAALGAIGIEPGDEVITSPWTMSASATAILLWGGVPVFADIDEETFNLDPRSIERKITRFTKAIVVPDIFGQATHLDQIMKLARRYRLKVIEDSSQAPGAKYKGQYVGTVADIGVFSLNYHKHIHTGEGGVCVTQNDQLAERLCLIRNHAEAVVEKKGVTNLTNMIGFNFRLTELQAAIGIEQLKKMNRLIKIRQKRALQLTRGLQNLKGLTLPTPKSDSTHVYYVYALILNSEKIGVKRHRLLEALQAEGVPGLFENYANLHLLPLYQRKIALGSKGFPWKKPIYHGKVSYKKGICPVAEQLQDEKFVGLAMCSFDFSKKDVDLVIAAFRKVWNHLDEL